MRVQFEVLQGWLQEKENGYQRHGWKMRKHVRWNLLKKIWNVKLISEFRELEKRYIYFLDNERLKGVESQQKGSTKNHKLYSEGSVLEASNKTQRPCIFKTIDLCMIIGTSHDDEQTLHFVKKKEWNLKCF